MMQQTMAIMVPLSMMIELVGRLEFFGGSDNVRVQSAGQLRLWLRTREEWEVDIKTTYK